MRGSRSADFERQGAQGSAGALLRTPARWPSLWRSGGTEVVQLRRNRRPARQTARRRFLQRSEEGGEDGASARGPGARDAGQDPRGLEAWRLAADARPRAARWGLADSVARGAAIAASTTRSSAFAKTAIALGCAGAASTTCDAPSSRLPARTARAEMCWRSSRTARAETSSISTCRFRGRCSAGRSPSVAWSFWKARSSRCQGCPPQLGALTGPKTGWVQCLVQSVLRLVQTNKKARETEVFRAFCCCGVDGT